MTSDPINPTAADQLLRASAANTPLTKLKRVVKQRWRQSRSSIVRKFFSYSRADLELALTRVGIAPGDLILVHSSWAEFEGFTGKPTDVINALRQAIGPSGTILMPTLPFTGTAVEHARSNPVFDVRRTPSKMGLISEIFRRLPGTERSVHPTHSVAAQGPIASHICAGHHLASTPCGEHSPFAGLAHRNGKIVLMGTGIEVLTFYHYVEELIEEQLPRSPFTDESYALQSKLPDGSLTEINTRLFDPAVSRTRRLSKLVKPLKQRGDWRETTVGRLQLISFSAESVTTTVKALLKQGIYCYE